MSDRTVWVAEVPGPWPARLAAARRLLGHALAVRPEQIRFGRERAGRPIVVRPAGAGVHVSFTDTEGLTLLAWTFAGPVGVDVERHRDLRSLAGVARRTMTDAEHAAWIHLPEADRAPVFFATWTAKEAVLKAAGVGLPGSMRTVDCGLVDGPRPGGWRSRPWWVRPLPSLPPGTYGTVALTGGTPFDLVLRRVDATAWRRTATR